MELYDHQKRFLEQDPNKCLLAWGCGTGKTRTAIEWSKSRPGQTLVICPKSIVYKWVRDIQDWTGEEYGVDSLDPRRYFLSHPTHPFTVMSKEAFKKSYDVLPEANLIVDECHFFAGSKSAMSKSLYTYIKRRGIQNILLMSATVYLSTPLNIYTLAKHLGHNWNYWAFHKKYFDERYFGQRRVMVPKKNIENDMAKLVATIGDIVDINECADIPEQTYETEFFELNKEQKKLIEDVYDPIPVTYFTAKHQIENGTLRGETIADHQFIDCDKVDRIKELVAENKKVAVVARYNLQLEAIKRALSKCGKPVYIINGAVKDRGEIVDKVEKDDECVVLINAACSCGYELPSVNLCVFASMSYSFVDWEQVRGRFLRLNRPTKNTYIYLIVEGGVDQAVYDAIMSKSDFNIAIYAESLAKDTR